MNSKLGVLGLLLCVGLTLSCQGNSAESERAGEVPRILAETDNWLITSEITGRTYEISVAFPRGYDVADTLYPVLYTVDANGQFGIVVETARALAWEGNPEPLVVGIGYPVGRGWNALSPRAVDLTPTADQETVDRFREEYPEFPAMEGSGGAPGFLRFLLEELIPRIEHDYKASSDGRAVYGHSFGGLFAIYAMLEGGGAFHRIIAGSPSLWWDHRVVLDLEEQYTATHDALGARVFVSVGELEEPEGDEDLAEYAMVANAREFHGLLQTRQYEGLSLQFHIFEDETHVSVIPATISRGLRFVYGSQP